MQGALQPGTRVAGRYVIDSLLGKGGMGAVYQARHEELGRQVALKVLLPEVANDADVVARFLREARTAAAIRHPSIVEVFDVGRDGAMAFIVMEKLAGEELAERIRLCSPLGPRFVALLGVEIAEAIAAAHARGVIHRDLKPHNVFLAERGTDQEVVKVLDFGIAKLTDGDVDGAQLTKTGEVFGTPLYMPPEQLQARKDIDARVDVYSIGVILYEALSGRLPFHADSYPALVLKIVEGKPEPLTVVRPDLPPELCAVVAKAMASDREQRYPSASALAFALFTVANALPPDPAPETAAAPSRPSESAPVAAGPGDDLENTLPRPALTPGRARHLLSVSKPTATAAMVASPLPAIGRDVPPAAQVSGSRRWIWAAAAMMLGIAGVLLANALTHTRPVGPEAAPPVLPVAPAAESAHSAAPPDSAPPAVVAPTPAPEPVKPPPPTPVKNAPRGNLAKKQPKDDSPPPLLPR